MKHWLSEIERYATDSVVKMLVGNKCDLLEERAVDKEMAAEVAEKLNVQFFEASAKSSANVEEIFETMARAILAAAPAIGTQQTVRPAAAAGAGAAAGGCC